MFWGAKLKFMTASNFIFHQLNIYSLVKTRIIKSCTLYSTPLRLVVQQWLYFLLTVLHPHFRNAPFHDSYVIFSIVFNQSNCPILLSAKIWRHSFGHFISIETSTVNVTASDCWLVSIIEMCNPLYI